LGITVLLAGNMVAAKNTRVLFLKEKEMMGTGYWAGNSCQVQVTLLPHVSWGGKFALMILLAAVTC
jgi:hypothetical protein